MGFECPDCNTITDLSEVHEGNTIHCPSCGMEGTLSVLWYVPGRDSKEGKGNTDG